MKRLATVFVLASAVLAAGIASAEEMAGNVQFLVGQRYLGEVWEPLDTPATFGVEVDFAPASSPVHVALAALLSRDRSTITGTFFGDSGSVQDSFFELSAGFLWSPVKTGGVRPYLGAGVLTIGATVGSDWSWFDAGDTDQSFGFYGNAGIYFKVGDVFNIGVDGRIVSGTSILLVGRDVDADYEQASLLMGFSFGK